MRPIHVLLMTFSAKEMAALLRAAKMMALADGTMTSDEKDVMIADLKCFGVQIDTLQSVVIEKQADEMDGAEVIKTLSNTLTFGEILHSL